MGVVGDDEKGGPVRTIDLVTLVVRSRSYSQKLNRDLGYQGLGSWSSGLREPS